MSIISSTAPNNNTGKRANLPFQTLYLLIIVVGLLIKKVCVHVEGLKLASWLYLWPLCMELGMRKEDGGVETWSSQQVALPLIIHMVF